MMAKERFDHKQIGLVLFHQLTRGPFIRCEPAHQVAQVPVDNYSESFSGDRAVVSNNYRKLSRGEREWRSSHKLLRVVKNFSNDKQNSLPSVYARLQPLSKNP